MTHFTRTARAALVAALAVAGVGAHAIAQHAAAPPAATTAADGAAAGVPTAARDAALPAGWRTSADVAWTTSADATGFHVLVAEARTGYTWRTAATLAEPGLEADQWVGNACVTGSGRRVVAVYAPRTFTNNATLTSRGAFTAVVDLRSGAVRKLGVTTSLASFNPGCGAGETVALTQEGDERLPGTRLLVLDAATGRVGAPVVARGQLTSAVPVGANLVAAAGPHLVRVDARGRSTVLGRTAGVPFRLQPDAAGGVSFLEPTATGVAARRLAAGRTTTLAEGTLGRVGLARGAGGRVFLTGSPARTATAGTPVTPVAATADAGVSTLGALAVRPVATSAAAPQLAFRPPAGDAQAVTLAATVLPTGRSLGFAFRPVPGGAGTAAAAPVRTTAKPAPATATARTPASAGKAGTASTARTAAVRLAAAENNPVDTEAWCAVPRNDVRTLAYQPTPRQVEWAVDYAIQNALTLTRPAGFKNFGLPAYSPQGLFPPRTLFEADHVPPQILLGVLSQESNLWQATRYAQSGEYANPLIGNYYGLSIYDDNPFDDWDIHWDKSDCGYGIGQVTDGMRKASHPKPGEVIKPATQQRAIALDYAANIAASLQILEDKWNETRHAGLQINNGDATRIENWFFATWAYNSGFHPDHGDGTPWGLGWLNNPANPRYPADRGSFLEPDSSDAAHPQDWPYPEKVIGWAAYSIGTDDGPGFRPAWWAGANDAAARLNRTKATPPPSQFCDGSNQCAYGTRQQPNAPDVRNEPPGPCQHTNSAGQYDLQCWYHSDSVWKPNCGNDCGHEIVRFDVDDASYPEQPDGTHRPPRCDRAGLPANAQVVDDVPAGTPTMRCGTTAGTVGSFSLAFAGRLPDYNSKIDFHQLGGGFAGHYWFTHAGEGLHAGPEFFVQATWRPPATMRGPTDIWIYLPEDKSRVTNASYYVHTGDGREREIRVDQNAHRNSWYRLGRFNLTGPAEVFLDNPPDVRSGDAIAFDAIAFAPA